MPMETEVIDEGEKMSLDQMSQVVPDLRPKENKRETEIQILIVVGIIVVLALTATTIIILLKYPSLSGGEMQTPVEVPSESNYLP